MLGCPPLMSADSVKAPARQSWARRQCIGLESSIFIWNSRDSLPPSRRKSPRLRRVPAPCLDFPINPLPEPWRSVVVGVSSAEIPSMGLFALHLSCTIILVLSLGGH